MENFLLFFVNNFDLIWIVVCIGPILIGLLIRIKCKSSKTGSGKFKLNKKELILSRYVHILTINIAIIFFILGVNLLIFGFHNINDNITGSIGTIVFGIIPIVIALVILFKAMKFISGILNGNYVVVMDVLKDKSMIRNSNPNNSKTGSKYRFYFKDYFSKYNDTLYSNSTEFFKDSKIGDEFFLVFIKGIKSPLMFNTKNWESSDEIEEKTIAIDNLSEYINIKEFYIQEQGSQEHKIITKKQIIKDFYNKDEKKTVALDIFLIIFSSSIGFGIWFLLEGENIIGPIIGCLFAVVFIFMTIVKIKYITSIISDIKHDRYKIEEDEVISINNNLNFKNTNEFMTFKLKNYKKILYADREEFNNTKVGDVFYLVFVKSEKEPIKFYSRKNVLIDELNKGTKD